MTESQHPGLAAVAEQVVALGREVESLRRLTDAHRRRLAERTAADDQLADDLRSNSRTLAGLAEQLAELAARVGDLEEEDDAVRLSRRSLFDLSEAAEVSARLAHLGPWVSRVYLRYPDAALATCWLWHPDVVEELLWLERAWTEAYQGKTASTQRAADWHERHRPGVARRVGKVLEVCGLEQHLEVEPPLQAPLADPDTVASVAAAWARGQAAPVPTPDQVAQARAMRP
jgi:hypothetical protein